MYGSCILEKFWNPHQKQSFCADKGLVISTPLLTNKIFFVREYAACFKFKKYWLCPGYFCSSLLKFLVHLEIFIVPEEATFFNHYFIEQVAHNLPNLPCSDDNSIQLTSLIRKISTTDATVLVNGPTGTGKEVISNLIHHFSHRRDEAFVAVNCAAIPDQMLESMLFGHEKGAFTGAIQPNQGLIRAADKGTVLLDEISEMPVALQAKLLRVIQEKKVMPIGSSQEVEVDVRIIATTNRNMLEEVKLGRFREDLFYRLNVFPLNTLKLAERKDDIPTIVANMLFNMDLSLIHI